MRKKHGKGHAMARPELDHVRIQQVKEMAKKEGRLWPLARACGEGKWQGCEGRGLKRLIA